MKKQKVKLKGRNINIGGQKKLFHCIMVVSLRNTSLECDLVRLRLQGPENVFQKRYFSRQLVGITSAVQKQVGIQLDLFGTLKNWVVQCAEGERGFFFSFVL